MAERARPLQLASVDDARERGRKIYEKRREIGVSARSLAERAGIDRGGIPKVERGDPSVRESTFLAVEAALDKLERAIGPEEDADEEGDERTVRVTVEGSLGLTTIEGPVEDVARLWQLMVTEHQGQSSTGKRVQPDPAVTDPIARGLKSRRARKAAPGPDQSGQKERGNTVE